MMESYHNRRKSSSCVTIVPPTHSKFNARKASLIPLKINTTASSMTEMSPITVREDQVPKHTWIQKLKQKLKLQKPTKNADQKHNQSSRIVRHSYSDPRLSPGSTAVGDDDEERQQHYFSAVSTKKTRAWVAAILMIVFGALIAVTFVLVGLGKALSGSSNVVASIQSHSTTTRASSTMPCCSSSLNVPTVTTSLAHTVINPTVTSS